MISYERALPILMVFGVYEEQAKVLASRYPLREVVRAMLKARGKRNPGGFVINCLARGWCLNPLTEAEYEAALAEFMAEAAARPEVWRKAMG